MGWVNGCGEEDEENERTSRYMPEWWLNVGEEKCEESDGSRVAVISGSWTEASNLERSVGANMDGVEGNACPVCLHRMPNVCLTPCTHKLCSKCVSMLETPNCPTCRLGIDLVNYLKEDLSRPFDVIRAEQLRREEKALEATVQVLVVGPPRVGKRSMTSRILRTYPIAPNQKGIRETEKNSIRKWFDVKPVFSDASMDGNGRFSPNALISNTAVRFVRYTLPLWDSDTADKTAILESLAGLKPDIIAVCSSYHQQNTFWHAVRWDRLLQAKFPTKPRIWCMLRYPGFDALSGEIVDRSDIYNSLKDLDQESYPKGVYIGCPVAKIGRNGMRPIAHAAVKFGRRSHGMEPPRDVQGTNWMKFIAWWQNLNTNSMPKHM